MNEGKNKLASLWQEALHDPYLTEQVFRDNEVRANRLIAKSMMIAAGGMLICWMLNTLGILAVSRQYVIPVFLVGIAAFLVPAGICLYFRGEKKWIRGMLLLAAVMEFAYLDGILTFNVPLLCVLPVIFSCRYYSFRTTFRTAVLTSVLFALSAWLGAYLNYSNPDLNFANADMAVYLRDVMLLSFLPRWIIFAVFSIFCFEITRCGREMVIRQNEISQKAARVNTELEMAGKIQSQALPSVKSFGENSFRHLDLAAEMTPAKEVGGDFYDFFYPDPSHLAMMIADVADKGIAASLYMMMSKTLLDTRVSDSLSPGKVLESVNRQLFENSPPGMFVTVWLGILDLSTGELVSASAGHEYPVLCRKDGEFELVKDRHGFVLGGMPKTRFPETSVSLGEGDSLFVYTDGIPEANNGKGEMFGTERMLASLNRHRTERMAELVAGVREDVGCFGDGAPQFDDMTMLALRLEEAAEKEGEES